MKKPHVLLAGWLASLAVVFFVGLFMGSGGERSSSGREGDNDGTALGSTRPAEEGLGQRDRTMRRSMDQMGDERGNTKSEVAQIIARARVAYGTSGAGMRNVRDTLRAMAPLAELDATEIQEALAEVERTAKGPEQKAFFYSLLLGQWAETDGRAALAYLDGKKETLMDNFAGVKTSILGVWALREPEAAWAWHRTRKSDQALGFMDGYTTSVIFSSMAAKDLDFALRYLESLDDSTRPLALSGIAQGAEQDSSRLRLLERAAAFSAERRVQIYGAVTNRWVKIDSEAALQWIRSLPSEEQKPLREDAFYLLMSAQPALGAEVRLEGVEEKDRPEAYADVARQWAALDLPAAGEWLKEQPQGPDLDEARAAFARAVIDKDPATAMDWAKSVQDEAKRLASIGTTYREWRLKDEAAAEAALDALGLPAEKADRIRTTPPRAAGRQPERTEQDLEAYFKNLKNR